MELNLKLKLADGEHPLVHEAQVSKVVLAIKSKSLVSHWCEYKSVICRRYRLACLGT